ncbi:hypothetical protein BGY98DRAFT_226427 [Russula aff. rugulosa BPL654]|nr:hypothetical protein BGY98DRAFT_226427 [Russula aff. rugulosa BPL654]
MFTSFRAPTSPSTPLSRLPSATPRCLPLAQAILLRARDGGQITLTLLIKLIIGETDFGEHRPEWMRGVLAMEKRSCLVMRAGFVAMLSSCRVTGSASSVRFFTFLISAFKCLVTSRPCSTSLRRCRSWTALRRMLATTASAIVSSVVWMIGTKGG